MTISSLAGTPACRLNAQAISHLRVPPHARQPCEIELSVYRNGAQLAQGERLAWGVYERQGCAR